MNQPALPARWVDPLTLHERWKPQLMLLCEKLVVDLEQALGSERLG
jgi:hypothetical protein